MAKKSKTSAQKTSPAAPKNVALCTAAKALVSRYVALARMEPEIYKSRTCADHLYACESYFLELLEREEGYPNPRFNGLSEAAAGLFSLHERSPDGYAHLMGKLLEDPIHSHLDSLGGLNVLYHLCRSLEDDHDYSFDKINRCIVTAEARLDVPSSMHLQYLYPSGLLEIVNFNLSQL